MYQPRTYRNQMGSPDLVSFRVCVEETDLLIAAERDLSARAYALVREAREQLTAEMARDRAFLTALEPLPTPPGASGLLLAMYTAAQQAGVGPMAAVAGAVAEHVARGFQEDSPEIVVENGGDIYIISRHSRIVAVHAGTSPLSGRVGLSLPPGERAVCTSSGTVGHSLSFGKADAAVIIADDGALADATATALGNRVQGPESVQEALDWSQTIPGIRQALVIVGETMGVWGEFELVPIA